MQQLLFWWLNGELTETHQLLASLMSTIKHLNIICFVYKRCPDTRSPRKAQHHAISQSLPSWMLTKNKTIFSILFYFHSIQEIFPLSVSNHTKLQLVLATISGTFCDIALSSNNPEETIVSVALLLVYMKLNWFSLIHLQCYVGERQMKPALTARLLRDGDRVPSRGNLWSPRTLFSESIEYCELPDTQKSHLGYHKVQSLGNSFICMKHQRIPHLEPEKPFKFWSILDCM